MPTNLVFFFFFPPKMKNGEERGKIKKKNENPRSADVFAICQEFIPIFVLKETHGEKIKVFTEGEREREREIVNTYMDREYCVCIDRGAKRNRMLPSFVKTDSKDAVSRFRTLHKPREQREISLFTY